MSDDDNLILPRTGQERKAYIQGFAEGVNMVVKKGSYEAATWLREMAELDGLIEPERGEKHE